MKRKQKTYSQKIICKSGYPKRFACKKKQNKSVELGNDAQLALVTLSNAIIIYLPLSLFLSFSLAAYYLQQCPRDEAAINECLRDSGNKLVHYLQKGIPELDIYEVRLYLLLNIFPTSSHYLSLSASQQIEPVVIDEIGIVLGSGPDGYRALFRNIQAFGVSNITVTNVR